MRTNRLEAFSDGVIAIIITIMVLELKVPHGAGIGTLVPQGHRAALGLYVLVALLWLIPDRRIEHVLEDAQE